MSTCPVFIGHLGERSFLTFPDYHSLGFPGGSDGKESACNERDLDLIAGLGSSPEEGSQQPTLVFLPGEFHGQRSLEDYSPWGRRVRHN